MRGDQLRHTGQRDVFTQQRGGRSFQGKSLAQVVANSKEKVFEQKGVEGRQGDKETRRAAEE
jgi:hypothetical protein